MKKRVLIALLFAVNLFAESTTVTPAADALAEKKCGSCHVIFTMSKAKFKAMKAPPFWAIAKKVKQAYPNRLEGIEFVKSYTLSPKKEHMIFPEETLEHFGLMPKQANHLNDEELSIIAQYMLDK